MIEYKNTYPDPRLKSAVEIMEEEAECDPDYVTIPRKAYDKLLVADFICANLAVTIPKCKYDSDIVKYVCRILGLEAPDA